MFDAVSYFESISFWLVAGALATLVFALMQSVYSVAVLKVTKQSWLSAVVGYAVAGTVVIGFGCWTFELWQIVKEVCH